jgi:peptidoglycan/LPS O-acetylase OafA/YrhL
LWSLAVEEQFYIGWPWVAARTRPRTLAVVCVLIVVGALVSRAVLHWLKFPDPWLYSATTSRADALAMGGLIALAFRSDVWRARLERALRPAGVLSLIALAALMVVTHGMNRNNPLVQIWGYSFIAVGSTVLVAVAARPNAPRWLDNGPLRFFGKYSYGIYIAHAPLKQAMLYFFGAKLDAMLAERALVTDLAFIVVVTLASVTVSLVSWVAMERPLLSLKDRLAPR